MNCNCNINDNHTKIRIVDGNNELLLVRIYEKTQQEVNNKTETVLTPFDLTVCDDVEVHVTGFTQVPVKLEHAISQDEDNCLGVRIPHDLGVGDWGLEVTCLRNGFHVRSFEFSFDIVETNCEGNTDFDVVDGCQSASVVATLQIVPQALVRGINDYEQWKLVTTSEDKSLQYFLDNVINFQSRADEINAAEAERVAAEQGRVDAEALRVSAESGRVTAENTRVGNENTRVVNEEARELQETQRANAERTRVSNESTRVSHETARVSAEEMRIVRETNREEAEDARVAAETARESACTAAVNAANAAATGAEKVNATLSGTTLTVTDRTGASSSVNTKGAKGEKGDRGADGLPGQDGQNGRDGVDGQDGAPGRDGVNGKSAYQSYVDTTSDDPVKTEAQWVASLKGDPSTADINLSGSVISVTNNAGQTSTIDVLASTNERVQIAVTSSVQGVSVANLTINAYYNDSSVPTTSVTTDSNGMAALSVPNGYKYRLVFPSIQGCAPIADVVHTASVSQRSVEVEYKEYVVTEGENVRVVVEQKTADVLSRVSDIQITVAYDGSSTVYTTDSTGTVRFVVPYGKHYTITAPQRQGWYLHENKYTLNLVAEQTNRAVTFVYRSYESGLTIIASDGSEFTLGEWEAAVEAETRQNSEAMLIKISTGQLAQNGGVFAIDIDMVRGRTQGSNRAWSSQNVQFDSVPLNGDSTSADYYYDGLTASRLVQQEGDERSIDTLAADQCLAMSRTIAAGTESELTLPGFLGSVGQWNELWKNVAEIDDILLSTRPNGTYLMSTWTTQKWTITQYTARDARYWGTAAAGYGKTSNYVVLPFFAY